MISIVLVAAAGYTAQILRQMTYNQHKIYATRYVEDLKEWVDAEREADWPSFQSRASIGTGTIYCVNSALSLSTIFTDFVSGTCDFTGIGTQNPRIFSRVLTLKKDASAANTVTAIITVSWYENDATPKVERLELVYTVWQ